MHYLEDSLLVVVTLEPPDVAVVEVRGEIDMMSAPVLALKLGEIDGGTAAVVDLGDVTFMDSSGLKVLLTAATRHTASGGSLVLRRPSEAVRRIVRLTKLEDVLPVR